MTFYNTHRSAPCSAVNNNNNNKKLFGCRWDEYRDPQLNGMQRVRDLGVPSTKWEVSIKSLFSDFRELCLAGGGKMVRSRADT